MTHSIFQTLTLRESSQGQSSKGSMKVWAWFRGFTSLGGLTQYFTSDNKTSKSFWGILTLLGLIMTVYGFINTIRELLQFKVTTSYTVGSSGKLDFPSVTICNANRIHCEHLSDYIETCEQVIV